MNQHNTSAQMAHTNSRKFSIEIAVYQRQHIGKVAKLVANSFHFQANGTLSKQTSNDLSGGLILRLRVTIRNGAHLRDRPYLHAPARCQKSECGFPAQLADRARSQI